MIEVYGRKETHYEPKLHMCKTGSQNPQCGLKIYRLQLVRAYSGSLGAVHGHLLFIDSNILSIKKTVGEEEERKKESRN